MWATYVLLISYCIKVWCFPGGSVVKSLPANAGDVGDSGLIPRLGRSPGARHDHPLQYSCLENPMDRGAWWATLHGVAKSQIWLNNWAQIPAESSLSWLIQEPKQWPSLMLETSVHRINLVTLINSMRMTVSHMLSKAFFSKTYLWEGTVHPETVTSSVKAASPKTCIFKIS